MRKAKAGNCGLKTSRPIVQGLAIALQRHLTNDTKVMQRTPAGLKTGCARPNSVRMPFGCCSSPENGGLRSLIFPSRTLAPASSGTRLALARNFASVSAEIVDRCAQIRTTLSNSAYGAVKPFT